jgi:translation elongation factor P/translation initiation factor 5A
MKEKTLRKKALEKLEKEGYVYWYAPKVQFHSTDILTIADILAIKGKYLKFIQITTIENLAARRKKIKDFLEKFKIEIPVEIWAWDKKQRDFRIEEVK